MSLRPIYIGDISGFAEYALYIEYGYYKRLLAIGFLSRSKTAVVAMRQFLGFRSVNVNGIRNGIGTSEEDNPVWKGSLKYVDMGNDHFTYAQCFNPYLGSRFLLTSREFYEEDFYNHLMNNFKLPLMKEWARPLAVRLMREQKIKQEVIGSFGEVKYPIHGKECSSGELMCFSTSSLTEEGLEETVSELIREGEIRFTELPQKKLVFDGLDEYFTKYGPEAVKKLHEQIVPLSELKANVTNLALKSKKLYPQQAASIEGIVALEAAGKKYAVVNHGMGCGKTIEAASACEAIAVGKWLKANPGKTLKDAYERDGIINYRTIIMAPGHLVEKWSQEVREEIPYAKVTIIRGLEQLCELREQGRKANNGKEFFVISKDKAKLGTQLSPTPTKVGWRNISFGMCVDCAENDKKILYKVGAGTAAECPTCHGHNFRPVAQEAYGKHKGLICPHCGELLLKFGTISANSEAFIRDPGAYVLGPADFSKPNKSNSACYHCGKSLWGANAKPVVSGLTGEVKERKAKWSRVSYFVNQTKKSRESAFILKGYEEECLAGKVRDGMTESPQAYGPRRYAPSMYVKKYLKGYFDFCILDEAHKYLGDSAQAVSAHALIKASRFTMTLTGTISNGTATCFYNLFYMLEPKRLLDMGFRYGAGERDRFCQQFGCVEREYAVDERRGARNAMSRGRALGQPKVKPGISPVLIGVLLMDCSLFMDISDLSKYLPKLKESVVLLDAPERVRSEYIWVLDTLGKAAKSEGLGMTILAQQLQFGLTYLDKPYGRGPIMHPYEEDQIVCPVESFTEYADGALLPKEEALINIVNQEMSEGRNCFVYATATNGTDACITERLKALIETHCNLKGRVEIIQSSSPAASEREAWFHKRAADGIKVFITNPRCVETGLDFCFKHEGVAYNYPTLIFYQISYELATVWQASRRAYRLSQKEECRTFYLAYANTLQAAALQIMAKKQVATAAIQGHFSAEGLASMAQGVDARTLLAQALSERDMGDSDGLASMFDVLASHEEEDDGFGAFVPSKSFYELTGKSVYSEGDDISFDTAFAGFFAQTPEPQSEVPEEQTEQTDSGFMAAFAKMLGLPEETEAAKESANLVSDLATLLGVPMEPEKPRKKKKAVEGQLTFSELFAVI